MLPSMLHRQSYHHVRELVLKGMEVLPVHRQALATAAMMLQVHGGGWPLVPEAQRATLRGQAAENLWGQTEVDVPPLHPEDWE